MLLKSLLFIYKTVSKFFEILIFRQGIWGNVHCVCEIKLIFKETLLSPDLKEI